MPSVTLELKAQIAQMNQRLVNTEKQLKELNVTAKKTSETMQKNFSKTSEITEKLEGSIKALLSVGVAIQFTKAIIAVRKEFEKYHAVLTNTLGSAQAATREMRMLQEFAAKTPFALRELTGAYVKLVNYGLKPTQESLRKMGDLASSVGKGFDQLTEAIADAVTGEFERLKEFGIKAKSEGSKVQFTFKGISTEVKNTSKDIEQYILSLGDLEGVSGSMAAISATLEGKISNLGDSFDRLLNLFGEKSKGAFTYVIGKMTDFIDKLIWMEQYMSGIGDDYSKYIDDFNKATEKMTVAEKLKYAAEEMDYFNEKSQQYSESFDEQSQTVNKGWQTWFKYLNIGVAAYDKLEDKEEKQIGALDNLSLVYKNIADFLSQYIAELKNQDDVTEEVTGLINEYNAKIKDLRNQMQEAVSKKEIENFTKEIVKLQRELDIITGKHKKEGEDLWADILSIPWGEINKKSNQAYKERIEFENDLEKQKDEMLEGMYRRRIERTDYEIEKEKELQERKKELYVQYASDIFGQLEQLNRARYEQEILAAEGNEEKINQIRKKYARKEQSMAISKAIISGAVAIVKNTAELGFVAAIPVNVLQVLLTALQIATIKAQRFSKGVIGFKGAGTETSDSNLAWISKNESVMTARETKKFRPYLEAMRNNEFPSIGIEIAKALEKGAISNNLNYDNSKEIKELRLIRKELKKRPFSQEYIENGKKVIKKGNLTTRINLN